MCVLNGVLSLTSVLGNTSIIFALKKTSSIPLSTRILLQCLALTDFATGFLGHPLYIAVMSGIRQEYSCENVHVILFSFFMIEGLLLSASFTTVTLMGVDRFLAIFLHLRYNELVIFLPCMYGFNKTSYSCLFAIFLDSSVMYLSCI